MTDSERLDVILAEIQGMKSDMQGMKNDMQGMKSDMQGMKNSIKNLEEKVAVIELNLENVTNRNIQILAEAHLGLSRKLDEALAINHERELLLTRVNVLEGEMRKKSLFDAHGFYKNQSSTEN